MPGRPLLVRLLVAALLWPIAARAVDPGSQLIACDEADTRVTITTSSHLDPSCTWTRGFEIVASDVVLDCQGAHIVTTDRRTGVLITAPTDVALSNVAVRNCYIQGFLNNVRITREGFRDLPAGAEYEHAFSNIVVEDSTLLDSRGVGAFVDGYVTGVTLRNLHVEGSGSAGIYLEGGSKDNVVEQNEIVHNGYSENGPDGQFFEFGGATFWFWGTGREGLAIDGSRDNRVVGNRFSGNSAGAILLYKNCGEFVHERPERWFERRYGADGNVIENNTIVGEDNGVWIASRMGENTLPMDCSDPSYLPGVVLDHAADDVVRTNTFENVTYGVRVEDDRAVVVDNEFTGGDPAMQAIVVGTRYRTAALGLPVDGTTITGNRAAIAGNRNPYRWIHGHANTTFADNQSLGRPVGFCEGVPPFTGPFVFVVSFVAADPNEPPPGPPPPVPSPEPLPPCPLACASAAPVAKPTLALRRLDTPPGDDTLLFRGRVTLAHPFAPALDPAAVGVGVLVVDAGGAPVLDVALPGGTYDAKTKVGWRIAPSRGTYKYVNRTGAPAAGVTAVAIRDLSRKNPGLLQFAVKGRRGAYPVDPTRLPLTAFFVLDPPTAETGQCGEARFPGPMPACTSGAGTVKCR